jgi:hypothetical protein
MSMTNVRLGTVDLKTGVAPSSVSVFNKTLGLYPPEGGWSYIGRHKLVTLLNLMEGGKLYIICPYMGRKEKDVQGIVIPGEFEYIPFTIKPNTVFALQ